MQGPVSRAEADGAAAEQEDRASRPDRSQARKPEYDRSGQHRGAGAAEDTADATEEEDTKAKTAKTTGTNNVHAPKCIYAKALNTCVSHICCIQLTEIF